MFKVPLKNGTMHHNVIGEHGAAKVMMAPAPAGTGIIAGGPMRAVFEVMGITDIVAKSHGSTNPYNMVRATLDALKNSTTRRKWRPSAASLLKRSSPDPGRIPCREKKLPSGQAVAAPSAPRSTTVSHRARPGPAQAQQHANWKTRRPCAA